MPAIMLCWVCLNGSLSLHTLDVEVSSQGVPNWPAVSLRLCFVEASRTVEKAVLTCYKADWLITSLASQFSAPFSHRLQYTNFMLQGKNAANEVMNGSVKTFDAWCCGAQSTSEQSQLSGPTSDSLHINLAWWAVTWRTSKLGGGCLRGYGHLPGTIR